MNRFDREHVDGIGDGLSLALGLVETAASLDDARTRIRDRLLEARRAKDLDNLDRIRQLNGT